MQQHLLTAIILVPVIGALATVAYSLLPSRRESNYKWIALGFTMLDFALSLPLIRGVGAGSKDFRFVEDVLWIGTIGARYHVGVDGISLWLVMLTTLLMPIAILSSWTAIHKATTCILRFPAAAGRRNDRRLRFARSASLLLVFRSVARADVLPDRNLGRRAKDLRRGEVLYLHRGRQSADAGWHHCALLHLRHV